MKSHIKAGSVLLFACAAIQALARSPVQSGEYAVEFPTMSLSPDEQIAGFSLDVACAHVVAITNIPDDWNIEITRAISSVERVQASAGHGISYIRTMKPFDRIFRIKVLPDESSCADVSGEINAMFDEERKIFLRHLALKRVR